MRRAPASRPDRPTTAWLASWRRIGGTRPCRRRVDDRWWARAAPPGGPIDEPVAGPPALGPAPGRCHPRRVLLYARARCRGVRAPRAGAAHGCWPTVGPTASTGWCRPPSGWRSPPGARPSPWSATWLSSTTCRPWCEPSDLGAHLRVVVADNAGGGIFSFLPPAARPWTTRRSSACSARPSRPIPPRWPPASGGRSTTWSPTRRRRSSTPRSTERLRARGMSVIRVRLPGPPTERGRPRPDQCGRRGGRRRPRAGDRRRLTGTRQDDDTPVIRSGHVDRPTSLADPVQPVSRDVGRSSGWSRRTRASLPRALRRSPEWRRPGWSSSVSGE